MEFHYAVEKNVQMVLALLKANNIKKVIASPGATNESIVASMQSDSYFEMYSCVDERSAAYMACGMAAESGEPVVLSCTGATSSRDYMPGLTEAYYRHLPILAITSSMDTNRIGHLYPQCTNRSTPPVDAVKSSYCIEHIKDESDEWDCTIKLNKAFDDLKRNGGGPVLLNLVTWGCGDYSVVNLPKVRVIRRISLTDSYPTLDGKNVLVFIGSHLKWSDRASHLLDLFCNKFKTVALCDHTSDYKGKYRVLSALVATQEVQPEPKLFECDVLVHLGEISGDYYTTNAIKTKEVWRVDEDGEMRDKFKGLTYIFEMRDENFLAHYVNEADALESNNKLETFKVCNESLLAKLPELPFSNTWIASQLAHRIPENAVVHLGILNSLRSWNFFEVPESVHTYCNVGGFGIDGITSSMIGASLVKKNKLFYAVLGDLAFFYDVNVLGNRSISKNIRILMINNGRGVEFHTYKHSASKFGEETDKFIAAAGHNGYQSPSLIKNAAESLGFEYLTAEDKTSFAEASERFLTPSITEKPMIFEVFVTKDEDVEVLRLVRTINGKSVSISNKVKDILEVSVAKIVKKVTKK